MKDQLFVTPEESNTPPTLLLEAVVLLIDSRLPWTCKVVSYLLERNVFTLLRELIVTGKVMFLILDNLLHFFPLIHIVIIVCISV